MLTPDEVAANIDAHLAAIRSSRVKSLRLLLWVIEYLLPLTVCRRRFSRMSARRAAAADRAPDHRAGARCCGRCRSCASSSSPATTTIRACRRTSASARSRAIVPLALPPLAVRPPEPGEDDDRRRPVRDRLGRGRGGDRRATPHATAAGSCCSRRARTCAAADFDGRENPMSALLYKESGLQATVDLGMTVLQGRVLGGTTLINNCICFRLDDRDIVRGDTLARGSGSARGIDPARAGALLRRRRGARSASRASTRRWTTATAVCCSTAGASCAPAALGDPDAPANWFRKNFNDCGGAGLCNWGCPHDRKRSALETYVTDAVDGGRARDARVPRRADRDRRRAARPACASATASATLRVRGRRGRRGLRRDRLERAAAASSGVRRNVGTRLSFNAATVMLAPLPEPHRRLRRRPDDGLRRRGRLPARELVPAAGRRTPSRVPGWFGAHFDRMRDYPRYASCGVVVGTDHNGRVKHTRAPARAARPDQVPHDRRRPRRAQARA